MKKIKKALMFLCCCLFALAFFNTTISISASEGKEDINHDGKINELDVMIYECYFFGHAYLDPSAADLNNDGNVDITDYLALLACINGDNDPAYQNPFIKDNISDIFHSLPSKGNSQLVIFYVDFPDCKFSDKLSAEEIDRIAFGDGDESSPYYPFESMSAFYKRSSKGAMELGGKTFSYTAKENIAVYGKDKNKLIAECYEAFDDIEDFSRFDSDGDGIIDATLFCVPEVKNGASNEHWWPCTMVSGTGDLKTDGVSAGFVMIGNSTPLDMIDFVNSYVHEMGHCMGVPDYYLYNTDDQEGFHGSAGSELMDTDLLADLCSFSKLMLGWYRKDQVSVFDCSQGTQTFTLHDAQNDDGNCVIIPYGELDEGYFSEYFIIEYSTTEGNNSYYNKIYGYSPFESGVRIHHVKADKEFNGWWTYFKYGNSADASGNDNDGIRLIRLVNDGNGPFKKGDVIDASVPGFGWYDEYEEETIDPGVCISVDGMQDDCYIITVSVK